MFGRRRLEHHLILIVVLHAVRVFAVAAVLRAARRLHVCGAPGLGTERAQKRRGVRRARADFHVVGLQQRATLAAPVVLEVEDDLLKSAHSGGGAAWGNAQFTGRIDAANEAPAGAGGAA